MTAAYLGGHSSRIVGGIGDVDTTSEHERRAAGCAATPGHLFVTRARLLMTGRAVGGRRRCRAVAAPRGDSASPRRCSSFLAPFGARGPPALRRRDPPARLPLRAPVHRVLRRVGDPPRAAAGRRRACTLAADRRLPRHALRQRADGLVQRGRGRAPSTASTRSRRRERRSSRGPTACRGRRVTTRRTATASSSERRRGAHRRAAARRPRAARGRRASTFARRRAARTSC